MKYSNQPIWALATFLTLLLAGCGGSSSTSGTPEMTELQKAQKAAMDASDMAKTKSDEAKTSADGAQEAVMGLAEIQTGNPMAKTHAEAARKAADEALAAYNLAKKEYDKTRAAGSRTVAVEARIAAEAASMEAERQAKIARDKAAEAVEAAKMEVKVSYDDDGKVKNYSVGDTTIMPGAPKKVTTTGGKTVTTGKNNDLQRLSGTYSKAPVGYMAKSNLSPEVVSRTGFYGVYRKIGTETYGVDSILHLYDRYISNSKLVRSYRKATKNGNAIKVTDAPATVANPYGVATVAGKTYKIMRAEGEFYRVTVEEGDKFDHTNAGDNIPAGTKDANAMESTGVYYYEAGGNKTWLLRESSTVELSGAKKITYRQLFVYDVPDFPGAKAYEHMNYGMWMPKEKSEPEEGAEVVELGTAFVSVLPGGQGITPPADMPGFGKATWRGHGTLVRRAKHAEGEGGVRAHTIESTTVADFGENTITTDLVDDFTASGINTVISVLFARLHGTIDGSRFSGDRVSLVNSEGAGYSTPQIRLGFQLNASLRGIARNAFGVAPSLDGSGYQVKEYSGNFFGPDAEEVGGVFYVTSEGRKNGEFRGSFGGRRMTE